MKSVVAAGVAGLLAASVWTGAASAALMHSPLSSMVANGNGKPTNIGPPPTPNDPTAQILSMNGVDVSLLQLGTTTFSGTPGLADQLPQYADEFGLSANASADGQTYVQTMFPQPTAMFFLIEKGGNDSGTMVGLDAAGQQVGSPIPFTAAGFNKTLGYTVFQGQVAGGMLITSDVLLHGIRFYANGLDPVSISSRPYELLSSGETFTWGERIATGSWSNTGGWRKNGVNTTETPQVLQNLPENGLADPVRILSGTVRVDAGNEAALSLQVDSGAGVEIATGFTLELLDAVNVASGGSIAVSGKLNAPSIAAQGTVSFGNGTLVANGGTIANVTTVGGGATFQNQDDLTIQKLTLGSGHALTKQGVGTLILDQASGANALASGSSLNVESGLLAAVNGIGGDALGESTVNLQGGGLVLSAKQAGAAAFDAPIVVSAPSTITASQAGGGIAGQSITLGGAHGVSIGSGGRATLQTADGYTINLNGALTGAGRLIFDDGVSVAINGAVNTATVEFRGDTANLVGASAVAPTQSRVFAPTEATPHMVVGFDVGGTTEVVIDGLVDGSVAFAGATTYSGVTRIRRGAFNAGVGLPAATRIQFDGGGGGAAPLGGDFDADGVVDGEDLSAWKSGFGNDYDGSDFLVWQRNFGQTADDVLPQPNRLAVLELSGGTFNGAIGSAVGNVQWVRGGGFASRGNTTTGELVVNLEGGAQLNWDSAEQGFNGQVLQLGSPGADGRVVLQNNISLGSANERIIQIADNPHTNADVARITGVISSSGGADDRLTINAEGGGAFSGGLLELLGNNTFANKLRIEDATVYAQQGVGLPTNSNLEFSANNDNRPAIFATNGTFTRNIGTAPGEVFWAVQSGPLPNGGGFAAIGGPLTVTLEGGADLTWSDPNVGFNGRDLQLGSPYGNNVVTFTNNVNNDGADRAIETFDNPFTEDDAVVLTGNITSSTRHSLYIDGSARVVVNGNINLAGGPGELAGDFFPRDTTTIVLNGTANEVDDLTIENSSNVFINGSLTVHDDLVFGDSANNPLSTAGFGGVGTITTLNADNTRVAIEASTRLRPGAGRGEVGALTLQLNGGGAFEMETAGTYEMDFQQVGGTLHHDTMIINGDGGSVGELALEPSGGDKWNLELNALNSVAGLVTASDQFDLFSWNDLIDLVIGGVNISLDVGPGTAAISNVSIVSSSFNASNAEVRYEIEGDYSGRIYVTGLVPSATTANASVPEPAGLILWGVAFASFALSRRRRHGLRHDANGR